MRLLGYGFAFLATAWTPIAHASTCVLTTFPLSVFGTSTAYNAETSDICDVICAASNCVAWDFGPHSGVNLTGCSIYDSAVYSEKTIYSRTLTARCRAQLPQDYADYPGLDISNTAAATADLCSFACDDTTKCHAYTWSNYNGGSCYLKSNKPSAVTGPYDGSVISGESNKCDPRVDSDIVGDDLASVQRSNWSQCCGVCRRMDGCTAFTWTDYNGGTCWLKSSIVPTYRAGVTGAISSMTPL
jgi:hypothetical protein